VSALALTRCSRDQELPLSFAQQRLWFLHLYDPDSPAYNMPQVLRLSGPLDPLALESALGEAARRHEVLRTRFVESDGEVGQVVAPPSPWNLMRIDLRTLPGAVREAEAQRLARAEAGRGFDLRQGAPWRASLVQLEGEEHMLLLNLHHIVVDGWSIALLTRDVAELYRVFAAGLPLPPSELPFQYADYAAWQRRSDGETWKDDLRYWRRQLAGAPAVMSLPVDRHRPAVSSLAGAVLPVEIGAPLAEDLRSLGRCEGATSFMTLLAGFAALLHLRSGEKDLLIGSPIANRDRIEWEGVVGLFLNTLVLRANLSGDPSFRDLMRRMREVTLEAHAHKDLPFEKLVGELRPGRGIGESPLFQVAFTLQSFDLPPAEIPGLTLCPVAVDRGRMPFELTLNLIETRDGFRGVFEYHAELFDSSTISLLAQDFKTLLEHAVRFPDDRLEQLRCRLSEHERVRWTAEKKQLKDSARRKFSAVRRKALRS
jgi:non-ribosomal peptide synthetase component F